MAPIVTKIAVFLVRMAITVVWALVLSKLIRSAWDLIKKHVRWERNPVATTN